jgi:hypothetical protein
MDVLKREWDVCFVTKTYQVEGRIAQVDLPVANPCRAADCLQVVVFGASGCITTPQCGATPAGAFDGMMQFPELLGG